MRTQQILIALHIQITNKQIRTPRHFSEKNLNLLFIVIATTNKPYCNHTLHSSLSAIGRCIYHDIADHYIRQGRVLLFQHLNFQCRTNVKKQQKQINNLTKFRISFTSTTTPRGLKN